MLCPKSAENEYHGAIGLVLAFVKSHTMPNLVNTLVDVVWVGGRRNGWYVQWLFLQDLELTSRQLALRVPKISCKKIRKWFAPKLDDYIDTVVWRKKPKIIALRSCRRTTWAFYIRWRLSNWYRRNCRLASNFESNQGGVESVSIVLC